MRTSGIIAALLLATSVLACATDEGGDEDQDQVGPTEDPSDPVDPGDDSTDPMDPPDDPVDPNETVGEAYERVLTAFMACMDFDELVASNMTPTWSQLNAQSCAQCHTGNGLSFIASEDAERFFLKLSTDRLVAQTYYAIDLTGGAANAHPVVSTVFEQLGTGAYGAHPRVTVPVPAATARQTFLELTIDGCGALDN